MEHHIWALPSDIAVAGNDLFSTLWASISSTLLAAASAVTLLNTIGNCTATNRWANIYFESYDYLLTDSLSPLLPSLTRLGMQSDRWNYILTWPLGQALGQLKSLASEARKFSVALDALATLQARRYFKTKISESLDSGDAFLHQFVKNDPPPPPHACTKAVGYPNPRSCCKSTARLGPGSGLHTTTERRRKLWQLSVEYWSTCTRVCATDGARSSV